MIGYDKFLPDVMPFVPDCAEFVATRALRSAAIEFCVLTDYLRHEHEPIALVPEQPSYDLELPTGMELARVLSAYCDDRPLLLTTEDAVSARLGRCWMTQTGGPSRILSTAPDAVRVVPMLGEGQADLRLVVSLRPSRASTGCAAVLWERWAEHIAAGAVARLYATPGQPYSNPGSVGAVRAAFMEGVGAAKQERRAAFGRPLVVAKPAQGAL